MNGTFGMAVDRGTHWAWIPLVICQTLFASLHQTLSILKTGLNGGKTSTQANAIKLSVKRRGAERRDELGIAAVFEAPASAHAVDSEHVALRLHRP